jgi:hypothetical protein
MFYPGPLGQRPSLSGRSDLRSLQAVIASVARNLSSSLYDVNSGVDSRPRIVQTRDFPYVGNADELALDSRKFPELFANHLRSSLQSGAVALPTDFPGTNFIRIALKRRWIWATLALA